MEPESTQPTRARRLDGRLEAWRRLGLGRHLAAVLLLALVLALRWWRHVVSSAPLNDEMIYLAAFRNVTDGISPFERSGYLSFSLLAHLGGWWLERFGQLPTLLTLRGANLIGVASAVWCAAAWAPWTMRRRWLAAASYVVVAPAVGFGMWVGNLSLAVSGLIVVALSIWPRRPLTAGALLAGSVIAKPLAPGAVLALLAHRPAARTRAHLLAAGSALVLVAAIVLGAPELDRALAIDPWHRLRTTVSPHKMAYLLGLRGATPYVSVAVGLLTLWMARRRPLEPAQLLCLAVVAAVATTPVVWSHTLLVTLPLQAIALAILAERRAAPSAAGATGRRRLELGAVLLAVLAIQLSTGATNIYDAHPTVQWLGLLPPMLGPWFLFGYISTKGRL